VKAFNLAISTLLVEPGLTDKIIIFYSKFKFFYLHGKPESHGNNTLGMTDYIMKED